MNGSRFTACTDCRHLKRVGLGRIWYDQLCSASPLPLRRDPFDGRLKPYDGAFIADRKYKPCRDVNVAGDCQLFAQRTPVRDALRRLVGNA